MKRKFLKSSASFLILVLIFSFLAAGTGSVLAAERKGYTDATQSFVSVNADKVLYNNDSTKLSSRFYELLLGKRKVSDDILLCPSGDVFGIVIEENGVTVCSVKSDSALEVGDRIIKIGSRPCYDCEELYDAVRNSGGAPMNLTIIRDGKENTIKVTPKYTNGEYALGITLRSRTAGIGTVTFVDPKTKAFGGLGHAVSDTETGTPVSIKKGNACTVTLGACKKGQSGKAGELSGVLNQRSIGSIYKNTECGVFGELNVKDENLPTPIPIAHRKDVKEGAAEIISTIKNGKKAVYKIEICDVDPSSTSSKSFKIKVTDPTLIALTGGIVRGMSGSPIIQDGKLVGAVTHVMVADPTEGYGIFIENMLSASQTARNELPAA